MKTTKDVVYEYVQKEIHTNKKLVNGIDTKTIAQVLHMHRSNVSALLNALVNEGKLVKTSTRPVYYTLPKEENISQSRDCFIKLVGYNGSLRKSIQLAKAAILYPPFGLHVLLSSQMGCGTTSFAKTMFQFAKEKGILLHDAQFIQIDCNHYLKNIAELNDELFGIHGDISKSCFAKAKGSMLFIDHVDRLEAKQMSRIFEFLDTGKLYTEDKSDFLYFHDVFLVLSCSPQNNELLTRHIPVVIELPELKQKSLQERFDLVNHFFSIEAMNAHRGIEVNSEVIKALLMSDFPYNIKEMSIDIKAACANAYVRVVNDLNHDIYVCLDDFKNQIHKGLMRPKEEENRISTLLNIGNTLFYDFHSLHKNDEYPKNIYAEVQKQYFELSKQGIHNGHIENAIHAYIQNLFKKIHYYQYDNDYGQQQLAKIVDHKVIEIVQRMLQLCKEDLGRNFAPNVFYGLCLHINSLLTRQMNQQRLEQKQIIDIIQKYPQEYACSVRFGETLLQELGLELPIEEIVFITMFLVESDETKDETHPVLLYIMHGNGTASSLKEVTNALTHCHNAYSYDLNLGIDIQQAMQEIQTLITQIDNGQGIIVIYDMGSIKTMLDTIADETDVKIHYINIPITLIGIDIARKCAMETDIDYVYHMANLELHNIQRVHKNEYHHSIIITLCHTGEGGAMQLKHYIDQYSKLGMKVVPLSISNREELIHEVTLLQKTYDIHTFVGTYNPKLLGIPFISISKIFENTHEDLDRILLFEPVHSHSFDYSEVYSYLETQLHYVSIAKLKTLLPNIIDEFSIPYSLSNDQKIGLFMHITCLIERLLEGKTSSYNEENHKIITLFKDDYKIIRSFLKPLEKNFKVIIDDNEIATIIMIVKKI